MTAGHIICLGELGARRLRPPIPSGLQIRSRFVLLVMKSNREIEILFRRLRLYDQSGRRGDGLVRTI